MGTRTHLLTRNALSVCLWVQHPDACPSSVIRGETRTYDAVSGVTTRMRRKVSSHAAMSTAPTLTPPGWPFPQEAAVDYRFMPEPNLPPLRLTVEDVTQATHDMPELLDSIQDRLMAPVGAETMAGPCYGLSEYDASVLVGEPGAPAYFEEVRETAGRWVRTASIAGASRQPCRSLAAVMRSSRPIGSRRSCGAASER